jgi:hypothetical protein
MTKQLVVLGVAGDVRSASAEDNIDVVDATHIDERKGTTRRKRLCARPALMSEVNRESNVEESVADKEALGRPPLVSSQG